jgi:two-component system nitrate/nitrite response regulator NarL
MEKINVLIVDDHPMVLEGMKALLANISYVEVVGTACNAFEAMDKLKTCTIHVAIIDINLPEEHL